MKKQSNKPKINIGLDIGIASVGWSIVDENRKIIEHGVRLFNTVEENSSANASQYKSMARRNARSQRRTTRRRQTLKRDFIWHLLKNKYISLDYKYEMTPRGNPKFINSLLIKKFEEKYINNFKSKHIIELRAKATNEKISLEESIILMYWYLSHRGFKYTKDKEMKLNDDSIKKGIELYKEAKDKGYKTALEIDQYAKCKTKKIKGHHRLEYSQNLWLDEIKQFFSKQTFNKNYKEDESFKENYTQLFKRQKSFEEGPTPSKNIRDIIKDSDQSKWSLYNPIYKDKKFCKGQHKKKCKLEHKKFYDTLWEKNVRKCSTKKYKDEFAAPKFCPTSEIFNLLNTLNNLSNKVGKKVYKFNLKKEEKLEILKKAIESKTNNSFLKFLNEYLKKEHDGKTYTEGHNPSFISSVKVFNEAFKDLSIKKAKFETFFNEDNDFIIENEVDNWINYFSRIKNPEKRKEKLIELFNTQFHKNENEKIYEVCTLKEKIFNENHKFSFNAMHDMMEVMLKGDYEQSEAQYMLALNHRNLDKKVSWKKITQKNYISKDWIKNAIISPNVKRSFYQSINLLNNIIKHYHYGKKLWVYNPVDGKFTKKYEKKYEIQNIVVELPREYNSKKRKEKIKRINEHNKKINKSISDLVKDKGYLNLSAKNRKKVKLWKEQNEWDAYTLEKISLDDLISNPNKYAIDHIIPKSIYFSHSWNNLVLTRSVTNAEKDNQTPFRYINKSIQNDKPKVSWTKLVDTWKMWYKKPKSKFNEKKYFEKYYNLTNEINYSDVNNTFGFVGRHINDTRYASKLVFHCIKNFVEKNEMQTKVLPINGAFVSFLRRFIETKNSPLERPKIFGLDLNKSEKFDIKTFEKRRHWDGHHAEDATIAVVGATLDKNVAKKIEGIILEEDKHKFEKSIKILETATPSKTKWLLDLRDELNYKKNDLKFSTMIQKNKSNQFFEQNITGVIKLEDKYYKKNKINLNKIKIKKWEAIFTKEYENLNISINKNDFLELKKIYKNYIDIDKPSLLFLEDKNWNLPKKFYIWDDKPINQNKNILLHHKDNKKIKGLYTGIKWTHLEIKKSNNDNKVAPQIDYVTAKTHKFVRPTKDIKYKSIIPIKENNIFNSVSKIYKGSSFYFKNISKNVGKKDNKKEYKDSNLILNLTGGSYAENTIEFNIEGFNLKNLEHFNNKTPRFLYKKDLLFSDDITIIYKDYLGNITRFKKFSKN